MSTRHAPLAPLDAPAARAPLHGLLSSPAAATTPEFYEGRWQGGASLYPFPSAMPSNSNPCAEGSERTKITPDFETFDDGEGGSRGFVNFEMTTLYLGEITYSAGMGDYAAWLARATRMMDARLSWALERQLAFDYYGLGNPHLADADCELPAGAAAVAAASAVAYLEGFLARRGQSGVIHVTPEVATYLGDAIFIADGQNLRTRAGTPVIVGAGYSDQAGDDNLAPETAGSPGPVEAGAGESWIFASSPIVYRVGEQIALPATLGEAIDRETNEVIARDERDVWVAFDGGPHAAVLADWNPS